MSYQLNNWIGNIDSNRSLFNITFPGAHNSGALGAQYDSDFKHGSFFKNLPLILARQSTYMQSILQKTVPNQERSPYELLQMGVRFLDLRAFYNHKQELCFSGHTLASDPFWPLLDEILRFINENPSEVILISLRIESNSPNLEKFWQEIGSRIEEFLIPVSEEKEGCLLKNLAPQGKNILLTCSQQPEDLKNLIWNSDRLVEHWEPIIEKEAKLKFLIKKISLESSEESDEKIGFISSVILPVYPRHLLENMQETFSLITNSSEGEGLNKKINWEMQDYFLENLENQHVRELFKKALVITFDFPKQKTIQAIVDFNF